MSGLVRQTVQENAQGRATSALLRVTNIVSTNTNAGGGIFSDTLFLSAIFSARPSPAVRLGQALLARSWAMVLAPLHLLRRPRK